MKKDIIPIAKDIFEISVDSLLNDGLLKDIPITNTIHSIYNICNTISDKLLFIKLQKFLFELDTLTIQERINLFEKLEKEPRLKQKTSIYILELFDKIDDENKAKMIFKVFEAYSNKIIDYEIFYRLNKVIKEISLIDIDKVKEIQLENINEDLKNTFSNIGLCRIQTAFDGAVYDQTVLCIKFIELKLDKIN
jgi:membrane protease subunit (stomatin/prohibitin family)